MKDRDQHLLWEAYINEKTAKPDYIDADDDGDTKESMKKALKDKEAGAEKVEETTHSVANSLKDDEDQDHYAKTGEIKKKDEDDDVQEEMDNLEFSAKDRVSMGDIEFKLQQVFVDAAADWIIADAEALTTPGDYQGYSMSTAFDDAKDFIKDALQDLSFSDVKREVEHRGGMILDPAETAFQKSVDDDIKRDDSRLQDMPPRDLGL